MQNIPEIEELIKIISKLPGLGPKSARRIILKFINNKEDLLKSLTNSLAKVYKNIIRCKTCGALRSTDSECLNCKNSEKKINQICIVETIADQWSIENSSIFKGYFHILGGTLSNGSKDSSNNLLIESLIERIKKNSIEEVIIATSATVEGQTTAFYIQESLKFLEIKVTKLAQGVPIGGEIESLDDGTLISAFKNRKNITSD